jgi:predicted RNA-binding Zn-ribbon protein involved in translation (DUF1610 family)
MRCKSCDYPLWNIKTRVCPECGTGFRPSDFEFIVNSVKFCCPHCGQHYYGRGERGHLVPPIFDCVKCGQRVGMDDMVLLPEEGKTGDETRTERMPWLERDERGPVKAWLAMIKWAMVQPNRLIRAVPENSSVVAAWLYATFTSIAFFTVGFFIPQVVQGLFQTSAGAMRVAFWRNNILAIFGLALGCGVLVVLWSLSAHGLLRISGKGVRPLSRTCHAIFYSAGANVLSAIPWCGWLMGGVWWIVSATNMVKEAHHVHGGRAAFAVMALPTICFVLFPFIWIAWLMFGFMGVMGGFGGGMGGPGWAPANMQVQMLATNLLQYGLQNNGAGPDHSIELLLTGNAMVMAGSGSSAPFCFSGTQTTPVSIPVNAVSLQQFLSLPRSQQFGEVQQKLNAMPANVIAHRFGDFVFTYHGTNLSSYDSNLWVVVMLPDPDANPLPAPGDTVYIGLADYTVTTTPFSNLANLVQQQNQHRAALGLPPLPDLTTVTHGQEAVAAPAASSPVLPGR